MSGRSRSGPILTLEPLIDAVRDGLELRGWELSGMQKTTSHRFEGRWEGDATRSAYLFFHAPGRWEELSIDIYLDETSRGLKGNLALVLDGREPTVTGDVRETLAELARLASETLPEGYRIPVSLRFRLPDAHEKPAKHATPVSGEEGDDDPTNVEIRFKVRIPSTAIDAGASSVSALASAVAGAFESLLDRSALGRLAVVR